LWGVIDGEPESSTVQPYVPTSVALARLLKIAHMAAAIPLQMRVFADPKSKIDM